MAWLKWMGTVGRVLMQVTTGAQSFAPVVKSLTPDAVDQRIDQGLDLLLRVQQNVIAVEAAGQAWGKTGPEKLAVAAELTAVAIIQSGMTVGKQIANPDLLREAAVDLTNAIVKARNAVAAPRED